MKAIPDLFFFLLSNFPSPAFSSRRPDLARRDDVVVAFPSDTPPIAPVQDVLGRPEEAARDGARDGGATREAIGGELDHLGECETKEGWTMKRRSSSPENKPMQL